jgi:hypothetical protein
MDTTNSITVLYSPSVLSRWLARILFRGIRIECFSPHALESLIESDFN